MSKNEIKDWIEDVNNGKANFQRPPELKKHSKPNSEADKVKADTIQMVQNEKDKSIEVVNTNDRGINPLAEKTSLKAVTYVKEEKLKKQKMEKDEMEQ